MLNLNHLTFSQHTPTRQNQTSPFCALIVPLHRVPLLSIMTFCPYLSARRLVIRMGFFNQYSFLIFSGIGGIALALMLWRWTRPPVALRATVLLFYAIGI